MKEFFLGVMLSFPMFTCSPINACEQSVAQLGAVYSERVRLECARSDVTCPAFQEYLAKRKALDLQCLPQSKP
jgi:hypothetical protein